MAEVRLPVDFQQSYLNYDSYPLNLIPNGTNNYRSSLESYKARLDAKASELFLSTEEFVHVAIRQFHDGS
jgi:hypothetical protein